MRLLLDTHVVLWWLGESPQLNADVRSAVADGRNDALVSAISVAEIAIKSSLGKLVIPPGLLDALDKSGFTPLAFTAVDAMVLRELPWHHRDPFDRMLVAQALAQSLTLVSADSRLRDYEISVLG